MKKKAILGIITLCTVLFAGCGNRDVEAVGENISKENGYASEIETVVAEITETVIEEVVEPEEEVLDAAGEVDYLALARACEQEFKIVDGEEYNCDVVIDVRGCMYIYEFPGIDVTAENSSLFFDYENAEVEDATEGKRVGVPVSLDVGGLKYFVGLEHVYLSVQGETGSFGVEEMFYCYDGDDEYRKSIDYKALGNAAERVSSAIIRNYDEEERTIELCYVTPVEQDTYTEYKIEKEEWITLPLDEEVIIISWSLGNTSASYISEDLFSDRVKECLNGDYFFATIYEDGGSIKGIAQILNP